MNYKRQKSWKIMNGLTGWNDVTYGWPHQYTAKRGEFDKIWGLTANVVSLSKFGWRKSPLSLK